MPLVQREIIEEVKKALKDNKITFYPDSKRDQLITYLEGLRDWNISRQIAWGIPIPAFQNVDNSDDWIFDERVTEEEIVVENKTYRRDPDVFDTWFSSSSWPYATLNYPDDDAKQFYPLSLMETGGEILYPWVSRMVMLGLYVTGNIPFKAVYIHGYVLAEDGSKMSKSLGNVIDPLEVIEKYGSDALRMGVVSGRAPAINRGYDATKVEGARNFANKLWNVARFIQEKVGENEKPGAPKAQTAVDHWMLSKLQHLTDSVAISLEDYRFGEAYDQLYETVWHEVADWYIEASKGSPNLPLLAFTLETILKVAHPFAPFVTEAIWQTLGWGEGSLLATSTWPEVPKADMKEAEVFEKIKEIVTEIRFITSSLGGGKPNLYYAASEFLSEHGKLIVTLANLGACEPVEAGKGLNLTSTPDKAWLDIDMGLAKSFVARLESKVAEYEMSVKRLEGRLGNDSYTKNAPKEVVEQTKAQLNTEKELLDKVTEELKRFREALSN